MKPLRACPINLIKPGLLRSGEGIAFRFPANSYSFWCLVTKNKTIRISSTRPVEKRNGILYFSPQPNIAYKKDCNSKHYWIIKDFTKDQLRDYFWKNINPQLRHSERFFQEELLDQERPAQWTVCSQKEFFFIVACILARYNIDPVTFLAVYTAGTKKVKPTLSLHELYQNLHQYDKRTAFKTLLKELCVAVLPKGQIFQPQYTQQRGRGNQRKDLVLSQRTTAFGTTDIPILSDREKLCARNVIQTFLETYGIVVNMNLLP